MKILLSFNSFASLLKVPLFRGSKQSETEDAEGNIYGDKPPLLASSKKDDYDKSRRVSSLTTFCVFLTAIFVSATGIIGGVYLYRQVHQHRLRHFRQWCSVPYPGPLLAIDSFPDRAMLDSKTLRLASIDKNLDEINEKVAKPIFEKFFDEEFDFDPESPFFERIEVPDFSDGRRGRYVHDFVVNKTGIVDLEEDRCFVLPLNRSMVYPPHSSIDLIIKLKSGFYDVDTEIVRESYRVVTPPITDIKPLGYYIARECEKFPTYRLEKVTSPIVKRDTHIDGVKSVFTEFAGAKISQIHIINLASIPGRK
ncbi:integral membrane protein 2B-like [Brevipalpus obovatus]|uniref:integral membrane protein 2B-like n=1 Tax=Brevipalpus obovatus TaxID=246614 RepID=UPI003D9ECD14